MNKTVSYIDPADPSGGNVLTGTVTAADFSEAKPGIEINGTESIPMTSLVTIYM
jgi:hypothetical protein